MKRTDKVIKVEEAEETIEKKEVTEAPVEEGEKRLWFKKLGGGSLRLNIGGKNRIIKPNEKFLAKLSEIPLAFRDSALPLEDIVIKETPPVEQAVKSSFEVRPRGKSKSMFDVFQKIGEEDGEPKWKKLTETPLPKAKAEDLKKDLER